MKNGFLGEQNMTFARYIMERNIFFNYELYNATNIEESKPII